MSHDPALIVPADATRIEEAGRILREGGLVAFPTETVYGLGADATSPDAVAAIYAAKGRPSFNPLIVHVENVARAHEEASFDARARALAAAFWPGPLTMVLPRKPRSRIAARATADLPTVALRIPSHAIARAVIAAADRPIAAPSANPSGLVSPTTARHVADDLGNRVSMVIDGGPCSVGVESTVVDLSEPRNLSILRPGGIARAAIEACLASRTDRATGETIRSPGQLAAHYAPRTPIRLDAISVEPDEALLAFGPDVPAGARATANLSATGDLEEAARNLFEMLRTLDRSGATRIAVMPVPAIGLGEAVRDRLARAAKSGAA